MSAKKRTSSAKKKKAAKASPGPKRAKTAGRAAKKVAKKSVQAKRATARPAKKLAAAAKSAKKPVAKKALAKKPVAAKKPALKAKAKPAKTAAPPAVKRRDGAGHLDPKYAAELRARSGPREVEADERAFLGKKGRRKDALAQELGEEFVETVTSGEDEGTELRDRKVVEELGGPFTVTNAGTEFGEGVDGSNPRGATREPFPRT